MVRVAIIGGGLSGLTTAYLLGKKGVSVDVYEKEKVCGGLMRSTSVDGFTFDDGGSHIVFSKDAWALDFMLGLLGNNAVKNRRKTKILYNGAYVKYPFENGLSDLSKEENYECLLGYLETIIYKSDIKPANLDEWCRATFGEGISRKYLLPYNRKIWKHDLRYMGLDWVERIPKPPVDDVIKSSLGIDTEGYTHQLNFFYPRTGGIHSIIKALEEKLVGRVHVDYHIVSVKRLGDVWVISNGSEEKEYDQVVSTIPLQELAKILDVPVDVAHAIDMLNYNSLITVMIGVMGDVPGLSWLYMPDETSLAHRVSFPSTYSPLNAPVWSSSVLAEVTCRRGDHVWDMTDDEIGVRVVDDMARLGVLKRSSAKVIGVRRTEYAYVINDLNYQRNLSVIRNYLSSLNVGLVGRFSEYKYMNMDDCIRSAVDFVGRY